MHAIEDSKDPKKKVNNVFVACGEEIKNSIENYEKSAILSVDLKNSCFSCSMQNLIIFFTYTQRVLF